MCEKTHRLLDCPIARARIPPHRSDASQPESTFLRDRDAHALQNAEDMFHNLRWRSGGHRRRVDGALMNADTEVLG
jgi:hypothetical protein